MNVLALCSGIGGLELGLGMATGGRARAVVYVERDAYAAAVLLARMEDEALGRAPVWDDLVTFDAGRWRGCVDLVSAGFPCQPWSVAGKRKGTEDERWIWPAIVQIIRDTDAPLVFLENVGGLLRHGLREVLSDLAEIGFDAEWACVSAADVGAPHRRERVFILGYRAGMAHGDEHGREVLRGLGLLDGERAARGVHADGCDAGMADAELPERRADPFGRRRDGKGRDSKGQAPSRPGERCARLEHPERQRLEGRGHPRPQRFAFPPGPGDAEGWERWLAAGGPAPAEPAFRRGAHGPAARMDRLRCLGNGVVPAQAALAFRILCERLA